jgi:hypothetical protein
MEPPAKWLHLIMEGESTEGMKGEKRPKAVIDLLATFDQ